MATSSRHLNIVLGVGGGIAAYKSASLLRLLKEQGHDVHVVPTTASLNFVGAATWEALSGHPVSASVWNNVDEVPHVRLGQNADLVIVAPATADLLSRAAQGSANDLLTNVLLTARCPVVLAPAMHTEMWTHAATRANVETLRSRGVIVIDPAVGRLTGSDSGAGRLPEPEDIARTALSTVEPPAVHDLAGRSIVITAGGTREYIDPVRFIGNRSTGKQGIALATTAANRGATVTLICANVSLPVPAHIQTIHVETGQELREQVIAHGRAADVIVMSAAVADFTVARESLTKIKKSDGEDSISLELVKTVDILKELVTRRNADTLQQIIVGFAAETGDESATVLQHGQAKLDRKGCDLLVVNEVGKNLGFASDDNAAVILTREPRKFLEVERTSKIKLSDHVWDEVLAVAKLSRS